MASARRINGSASAKRFVALSSKARSLRARKFWGGSTLPALPGGWELQKRVGLVRALLKDNGRYSGRAAQLLSPYFHSIRGFNCLRLRARQTNVHSPATFAKPLKLNCRKPSTDLIQPLTGSTSPLRLL